MYISKTAYGCETYRHCDSRLPGGQITHELETMLAGGLLYIDGSKMLQRLMLFCTVFIQYARILQIFSLVAEGLARLV